MGTEASGPRTVAGWYDPGADAADRYPDWVIRHRGIGVPELLDLHRQVILLDRGQTPGARRASLAHAIAHLDLDHRPCAGLSGRQECAAELLAALRCIPIPALADAIRWHGQRWPTVAEALMVDERMLHARLEHLHPAHRADLNYRLAAYVDGLTV